MSAFAGDHKSLVLLVVASLDARISIYLFREGDITPPLHLFTCPKAADPLRIGHHPTPVDIAIRTGKFKVRDSTAEHQNGVADPELKSLPNVAVFYTSGQLSEWAIPLSINPERESEPAVRLSGTPKMDSWLEEFWQVNGEAWRRLMPRFCYLNYYYGGRILFLGSRNIGLTIDRRKVRKKEI